MRRAKTRLTEMMMTMWTCNPREQAESAVRETGAPQIRCWKMEPIPVDGNGWCSHVTAVQARAAEADWHCCRGGSSSRQC
jgi:hypothetical protein